jgi:hypothetical protein
MECFAETFLDQASDSRRRPEFGLETKLRGRMFDPGEYLAFLVAIEPGFRAGMGLGREGFFPFLSRRRDPTAYGSLRDSEHTSHFGRAGALQESLDGAFPTPFEFDSASVRSHASVKTETSHHDKADCRSLT